MSTKKKVVWGIVAVVVIAIGIAVYALFYTSADNEQSPYSAIPENAIFVLETPSFTSSWKELSNSPLWNVITKNKFYAEISANAERLDSIIKDNRILSSYFSDKHLVISAHMINNHDYDFLMVLDTHKNTERLMPVIEGLLKYSSVSTSQLETNGVKYAKIHVVDSTSQAGSDYYLYYKDNLLYFSMTQSILENAIKTTPETCIKQLLPITYLHEEIPNGKIFKYYFNYKELVNYMRCFFSEGDVWGKIVSDALTYTALDTQLDEQEAKLSGITSVDLTTPSYFKALSLTDPGKLSAQKVIPSNVALSMSISFDSFKELQKHFNSEYQQLDEKNYDAYKRDLSLIEKYLGISFDDNVFSWIGHEINICKLAPASTSQADNIVIFVEADDIDKAKEQMNVVMDKIKGRTPVTFKTFDHLNHNIFRLEVKGFFKPFFGNAFAQMDMPYFTYLDNFVVFSNSPQELIRVINSYSRGEVLSNSPKYQNFQDKFSDKSTFSIYIQMPKLYTNLYQYSNAKTRKELLENKEFLESFSQIGVQLIAKKGQFKTQVIAVHDKDANFNQAIETLEEDATELSNLEFESKVFLQDIPKLATHVGDTTVQGMSEDGVKTCEGMLHDSIPQGQWRFYYPSGNLKGLVIFNKGGAPDKKAVFYQDKSEGVIKAEMTYDDGELVNNYVEYYLKGNRKALLNYKNGKPHGDAFFYYENGALKIEGSYKKGTRNGKWKYYSPDGELINKMKQ